MDLEAKANDPNSEKKNIFTRSVMQGLSGHQNLLEKRFTLKGKNLLLESKFFPFTVNRLLFYLFIYSFIYLLSVCVFCFLKEAN